MRKESVTVEQWLRVFGPGTAADVTWWLGSTARTVRTALARLRAVDVALDGRIGYVLPDDAENTTPVEPWAALLPPLDPTTMGWFEREWYVGLCKAQLFGTSGNAGPTVWWNERIVAAGDSATRARLRCRCWRISALTHTAIELQAAHLTAWFGGTLVCCPASRHLSQGLPSVVSDGCWRDE